MTREGRYLPRRSGVSHCFLGIPLGMIIRSYLLISLLAILSPSITIIKYINFAACLKIISGLSLFSSIFLQSFCSE